ncbi:MAG: DbpA RNA binding domain-containing protein, partial [Longimicrobiales bacterium]
MGEGFDDLGLSDAIVAAARAAGCERPTPLQAAAAQVLRRGSNVVLHASSGAGIVAAFGMPLLDRLLSGDVPRATAVPGAAPGSGPRALVLAPTQRRAELVAEGLSSLAGATGLAVRAAAPGWSATGGDVLVTTPARALEGVETSELKLGGVQTLVITDAAGIFTLNGGGTLETLAPLVPRDAQRVITSAELTGEIERFIESHVRKALTVPARPAAPPRTPETVASAGQIGYMMIEESAKPEVLARLLASVEDDALVFTRTAVRAERVLRDLSRRGIADGVRGIRVLPFAAAGERASRVISYDVPFSAEELRAIHANGGTVFITAAQRAHFRRIAGEVAFTAKHRRARVLDPGPLDAFRNAVRAAIEAEDLESQLLVLEPLMDEHSAPEIAAALSALLRRRAPAAGTTAAAAPAAVTGAPPAESTSGGLTRLFVSVGTRDNIRAGDLVGAITGEANIKGEQVGRVDIRESFSVVEVASAVAERVIRALNGTTMRGRSLRVDYDRKGAGGGASTGQREGRAPRGPG